MKNILLALPLIPVLCAAQTLETAYDAAHLAAASLAPALKARPALAEEFPKPDDATLKMLAKRIPGLKPDFVRAVPFEAADSFAGQAADKRQTFLDVLTASGLGTGADRILYVSAETLAQLDKRYDFGTWPISGKVTRPANGGSFRLEAVVVGDGWTKLLYDRGAFRYQDGKDEVEIAGSGTVGCKRRGQGSISLEGLKGCGCLGIFCGCAELQGMRKVSATAMKVDTSRGEQDAPLSPILRK